MSHLRPAPHWWLASAGLAVNSALCLLTALFLGARRDGLMLSAYLSSGLSAASYIWLAIRIWKGDLSNLATWMVTLGLSSLSWEENLRAHTYRELYFTIAQVAGVAMVIVITVYRMRKPASVAAEAERTELELNPEYAKLIRRWSIRLNIAMTIAAAATVIARILINDPAWNLGLGIMADACGTIPSAFDAFFKQHRQFPLGPWYMDTSSSAAGVAAVGDAQMLHLAFPLYWLIINLVVIGARFAGRWWFSRQASRFPDATAPAVVTVG